MTLKAINSFCPTLVFFPSVLRHLATCVWRGNRVIVFVPYRLLKVKMSNTKAEKVMSMINMFREYGDNEDMNSSMMMILKGSSPWFFNVCVNESLTFQSWLGSAMAKCSLVCLVFSSSLYSPSF